MISEQQQEQASLYALGALTATEREAFEAEVRADHDLQKLLHSLQATTELLARASPPMSPPAELRNKIMSRIKIPEGAPTSLPSPAAAMLAGLRFTDASDAAGWKQLPVPGASIKLLSMQQDRGYAVLMGKLAPGTRYPAHVNAGPEDFVVLSGDLHIGSRKLNPGDFHHAEAGSQHEVNYSEEGCTLVAVLTTDDPLVAFAMS